MQIDTALTGNSSGTELAKNSTTIRHLVEIDPVPDQTAFYLRSHAASAQRWTIKRLGNYQSVQFSMPGITGLHQPSLAVEFQADVKPAERKMMWQRQFAGARNLRALRVTGGACDSEFLRIYKPDIFIHDDTAVPEGFFASRFALGGRDHVWNFTSEFVRNVFEERHLSFLSRSRQKRQEKIITFNADDLMINEGFYKVERDAASSWIWSGAGRKSSFFIPRIGRRRLRLILILFGSRIHLSPETVGLNVDGMPVDAKFYPDQNRIEADFDCDGEAPSLHVSLHHGQLGTTADGSRSLGLAVHKVILEAL